MKLKKLAAGACALALGAAMMAMPASAETFSSTNSASQDVTATGTTTHSYAVNLTWAVLPLRRTSNLFLRGRILNSSFFSFGCSQ